MENTYGNTVQISSAFGKFFIGLAAVLLVVFTYISAKNIYNQYFVKTDAKADGFRINSYEVEMTVGKDNVIEVEERINVYFYEWNHIAGYHLLVSKKPEMSVLVPFISAGLISVVGTMAVGIGISALLSPFFVTRYIYVVCPVAWLVIGLAFSKMKLSAVWVAIFLLYSVVSFIPSYKAVYYEDLEISNRTEMVRSIVANMGEDDVIITDFADSTMPNYYFGENNYKLVFDLNELNIPDDGKNYWLIVGDAWSYDDIVGKLAEQGIGCEVILDYGLLGHTKILGYRCVR